MREQEAQLGLISLTWVFCHNSVKIHLQVIEISSFSCSVLLFVEPLARRSCYNFCSVYVRASVRICPEHNLYTNAWISKQFGTAVALEEKCHLKNIFICRLKVKCHRGQIKVKMVIFMY